MNEATSPYDDEVTKICPVCGFDYVHILQVLYLPDTEEGGGVPVALVSDRGTGVTQISVGRDFVAAKRRGAEAQIAFNCESGHAWVEYFSFHKGKTYASWERNTELESVLLEARIEADREDFFSDHPGATEKDWERHCSAPVD